MKFEIGGSYSADDGQNRFYIADDGISLMYSTTIPYGYAYSVFLGEDWRCEMIADSDTGRCVGLQCLMSYLSLSVEYMPLAIPESKRKELYFTLGKLIMGLRVVDASSGEPASTRSLIIRNITFYLPPVELIAFMTNGRTIGDKLSGSTVVEKKKQNTES